MKLPPRVSFQTWTEINVLTAHMACIERRLLQDGGDHAKSVAKQISDLRYSLQTEYDINVTEKD